MQTRILTRRRVGGHLSFTNPMARAVEGVDLIRALFSAVRSYVNLINGQALATALWVLHTYAINAADMTPRLAITSQPGGAEKLPCSGFDPTL